MTIDALSLFAMSTVDIIIVVVIQTDYSHSD